MPRLSRSQILYDGCYAHVISRSIRKMEIFRDEEDFNVFYKYLRLAKKESGFKIFHYCLMPTHFHLAVEIPNIQQFAKAIQKCKSLYIGRFHAKYKLSGPVWSERYRSLLIENDQYLYACGRYIENNPLKAGLVRASQDWKYSSCSYYYDNHHDVMVDGYGGMNSPMIPQGVDSQDENLFEMGTGIGSKLFRYDLNEKFRKDRKRIST